MDQFLQSLRHRRAVIERRIMEEQTRPMPDSLRLQSLKLKLRFRDQIDFIERLDRRGGLQSITATNDRDLAPNITRLRG